MKFTTVLISALAAVTAVAAVPMRYDDSPVFARSDDGELFVRYDDVIAFLEARGGKHSKVDKPPSYKKASRDPAPDYERGTHPAVFHTSSHSTADYSDNHKSATTHNAHHHPSGSRGSGSGSGRR